MFVIESKFGNDGYAFWFKLLETLCQTEGHCFHAENPARWEFLLAKTHVSEDIANAILDTLSTLEAIDKELWQSYRLVWCQKLVDNVKDAYDKRVCGVPHKPVSGNGNHHDAKLTSVSDAGNLLASGFQDAESPKLNNSKLNNSKLNNSKLEEYGDKKISAKTYETEPSKKHVSISEKDRLFGEAARLYEQLRGRPINSMDAEELKDMAQEYGEDWLVEAVKKANSIGGYTPKCIRGIMETAKRYHIRPSDPLPDKAKRPEDKPVTEVYPPLPRA